MTDPAHALQLACTQIAEGDPVAAAATIDRLYPFTPFTKAGRRYSEYDAMRVYIRDGFIDRYSGQRLVNPAALRMLSAILPDAFPAHPNWKPGECHVAYWELSPTIDHLIPVARGGADSHDNWVTTSMHRNGAKANALLEEIGWSLHPPGHFDEWDGLTVWSLNLVHQADPPHDLGRHAAYVRRWLRASQRAIADQSRLRT